MSAQDSATHAAELHRRAIVIDGHCDILMPVADGKMRLGQRVQVPDPAGWVPPAGVAEAAAATQYNFDPHTYFFGTMGQYDIPRFVEGGLTVQSCALYLEDHQLDRALQRGLDMVWWLRKETQDNPNFELVTTVADIRRLKREGKCGAILALEGFEPLGFQLRYLDLYYELGLRMASLTHSRRNCFGDGPQRNTKTGGLTAAGKQAIQRMNELGILVDLGHMDTTGFWEIIELCRAPLVYSHITARMYFPITDDGARRYPGLDLSRGRERMQAIADTGGLIGVIFYGQGSLDGIVEDIEYVMEVVGVDHVGLGSDLYGVPGAPKGLEDMSKLPALTQRLVERGHSDETILKILGGNYMRILEQVWKS